jgi:hypothetical protein
MEHVTVSIDETNGEYTFLVSDLTRGLLDATSTVKRASRVEPVSMVLRGLFYALRVVFGEYGRTGDWTRTWGCEWRVNLTPVNGPILPETYTIRQKAIDAEIIWLETNFL